MNGLQANLIVPTSLDTISFFIRDNLLDFDLHCLGGSQRADCLRDVLIKMNYSWTSAFLKNLNILDVCGY